MTPRCGVPAGYDGGPMRSPLRRVAVLLLVPLAPLTAQQDPPELHSGPAAGEPLPACVVFAPSGPSAGQEYDVADRIGAAPAAVLVVHELTRNTGPMITGIDRLGVQLAWTGLQVHVVRLAADRTDAELASVRQGAAMSLHRPLLVSVDGAEGPGAWALHRKATLTLVLVKDRAVVRSVAFTDTGRGDLGRLRTLVGEVTGPVPTEPDALRAAIRERLAGSDPDAMRAMVAELAVLAQRLERAGGNEGMRPQPVRPDANGASPGRRPGGATTRKGAPPDDDELRALLRRAIQKAADGAELDEVFAAITARAAGSDALRAQALAMFELMLSLDYGNDEAKRRARGFVAEHAGK